MIGNRAGEPDVILVGAGIISATLGVFLKELEPALNIVMVETLDGAALEDLHSEREKRSTSDGAKGS